MRIILLGPEKIDATYEALVDDFRDAADRRIERERINLKNGMPKKTLDTALFVYYWSINNYIACICNPAKEAKRLNDESSNPIWGTVISRWVPIFKRACNPI